MVVIMPGVAMGGNHHFKSVAPQLLCQRHADLVRRRRVHLVCLERLIAVIAEPSVRFLPKALGFHKLRYRVLLLAVQTGHILALLGFHLIGGIFHHAVDGVQGRLFGTRRLGGLFRVTGIVYYLIHAPLDGPDRSDRHQLPVVV